MNSRGDVDPPLQDISVKLFLIEISSNPESKFVSSSKSKYYKHAYMFDRISRGHRLMPKKKEKVISVGYKV